MNRSRFKKERSKEWKDLDDQLEEMEAYRRKGSGRAPANFPDLYQRACRDLALSKYRLYGSTMAERLNRLVIRGHRLFYKGPERRGGWLQRFILQDLPRAVRADWKLFLLSQIMFWVPFLAMIGSAYFDQRWVYAVLGSETVANLDAMYAADSIRDYRAEPGENFRMFGHYILNNTAIDFRIFAGGILFGLGTLFFLIFNGVFLGAAAGYMSIAGHEQNFWTFVSGHAALELTGMVLAGVAGLKLGGALIRPGNQSRLDALHNAAKIGMQLLIGAAIMTVLAAFVEGFWSAGGQAPMTKYIFGAFNWIILYAYLFWPAEGVTSCLAEAVKTDEG